MDQRATTMNCMMIRYCLNELHLAHLLPSRPEWTFGRTSACSFPLPAARSSFSRTHPLSADLDTRVATIDAVK